jgi:hypothetical protein
VTQPEEWGRRFLELTADAGRTYDQALRRYNELLGLVATGKLRPEQVQAEFRDYLQERGSTSTRELVELSVGLLAGLLHLEAKYREALLEGLLPADSPIPPPPQPSSIDLTNWFQMLSKYAVEQSARSVARQQQLVERIASGAITPERMQEQGRRYLESHAPLFTGEVVELGLGFVSRMQRSSTSFTEGLYDRLLGPEVEAPETALIVELRGVSGSTASAEIEVENTRAEAAQIVCAVSEFVSRTRGHAFVSGAEVAPARFALAPGEARDVTVSLPLDRTLFNPGVDYFGILRIAGARDREMVVQLIARADLPDAPPRPKSTERPSRPRSKTEAT